MTSHMMEIPVFWSKGIGEYNDRIRLARLCFVYCSKLFLVFHNQLESLSSIRWLFICRTKPSKINAASTHISLTDRSALITIRRWSPRRASDWLNLYAGTLRTMTWNHEPSQRLLSAVHEHLIVRQPELRSLEDIRRRHPKRWNN
jgi:hypothetical protein